MASISLCLIAGLAAASLPTDAKDTAIAAPQPATVLAVLQNKQDPNAKPSEPKPFIAPKQVLKPSQLAKPPDPPRDDKSSAAASEEKPDAAKPDEKVADTMPASSSAAPGLVLPFRTRTAAMEVIGGAASSALPDMDRPGVVPRVEFRPVRLTTAALEVLGGAMSASATAAAEAAAPETPFTPVRLRTGALEVIGTPLGE